MEQRTIPTVGKVHFQDEMADGLGIRNARRFLADTAVAFARECKSYYDVVKEFQFIYREKQVNSALLPAISKTADAVLLEQPVSRRCNQDASHGWLDYWVAYGTTIFLIEVKHSWNAIRTENIRQDQQAAWKEALDQLKRIHKRDVYGLSEDYNAVKMALMVVPFYCSHQDEDKSAPLEIEQTQESFESFVQHLKPAPHWRCLWHLHSDLQGPFSYQDEKSTCYEMYPCVGLVANVVSVT